MIVNQKERQELERQKGWLNLFVSLPLDNFIWEATGEEDPLSRLQTSLLIGGTLHHVDARQVKRHPIDNSIQFKDYDEDYATLAELAGDAPKSTVHIEGREYMLLIYPYC